MAKGLPAPLLQLPHEILDDILSALDQHSDLLSLALTCRHLASSIIPYHTDYRALRIRTLHPAIFAHLARRRDLTRNVREVHICERNNYTTADRVPRELVDKDLDLDPTTNGTNDERVRVWNVVRSLRHMWDLRTFTWSWNFSAGTAPQGQSQASTGGSLGGIGGGVGRVGGPVRPTSDHRYEEAILAEVVRKPSLRHFGLSGGFGLHVTGLPLDKGYSYPDSSLQVWHLSNLTSLCLLGDAWLKACNILPLCFMLQKSPNLEYLEIPLEFKNLHTLRFPSLKKVKLHLQSGATTAVDSSSARFLENNPTIEDLSWYPIGVPIFHPHVQLLSSDDENESEEDGTQGFQLVLPNLKSLKTNLQGLEAFENEWELKCHLVGGSEPLDDSVLVHAEAEKLPKIDEEDESEGDSEGEEEEEDAEGGYATYPSPSTSFSSSQNPRRISTGSMNWASYLSTPSTPMTPSWPWPADPKTPTTSTFGQMQSNTSGQIQQDLDYSRSYYSSVSPPASPLGSMSGPPTTPTATWTPSTFSTFASLSYAPGSPSIPSPNAPMASTPTVPAPSFGRLRKRRLISLDVSGLTPSHLLSLPFLVPSSLKRVSIQRFSTHEDVERLVDVAEKFHGIEWASFPATVRHAGSSPSRESSDGDDGTDNGASNEPGSTKNGEGENGEWWTSGTSPAPPQPRSYVSLETLLRILPLFKNLRVLRGRALWSAVMNDGDGPDPDGSQNRSPQDVRALDSRTFGRHLQPRDHPTEYHKMKMHQVLGELIRLCPRLEEVDHCDWYEKRWAWKRVVVLRRREGVANLDGRKRHGKGFDKGKQKEKASDEVEVVGYEVRKPFMRVCFDVLDGAFN